MRFAPPLFVALSVLPLVVAGAPLAADVEGDLKASVVGLYGLARSPLLSECSDSYTNNQVAGGRISGKAGQRFAAGELVRIDNLKLGSFAGLQVYLSIVEPYRMTWQDGPYEVHDQRRCRVQLDFEVPRDVRKDAGKSRAAIEAAVALFDLEAAARKDPAWNRREVEPYPDGWEKTKKEWQAWRKTQQNRRVREKTEEILEQAERVISYMPSDAAYLASFGAGARDRSSESWSDCDAMLSATFYVTGSGENTRGWADGQLVSWAAQLARALADCYVEE
jgi:hypothetical protein